jgi:branched-chain amino acid transport system substrate-binding protein
MDVALAFQPGSAVVHAVLGDDPALASLAAALTQAGQLLLVADPAGGLRDVVEQLEARRPAAGFAALALHGHGRAGMLQVGDQVVSSATLERDRALLERLGRTLAPGGDLLLYGCDLASGAGGEAFVAQLAALTGTDLAASSDRTFADALTGQRDWDLEVTIGSVTAAPTDVLTGLAWSGALAARNRPIVVALEGPLTGEQSSTGVDMWRGAKLAVKEINAAGGVGPAGRRIKLIRADDRADPEQALPVAKQVRKAGAGFVVGPYNSSVGLRNLDYYLARKIVPVHLTSTDATSGQGVTIQPKNSQISPVEADYIKSLPNVRTVQMLVDPSAFTQGMADRLEAALTPAGIQVKRLAVVEGQANYTALVDEALQDQPDLIYSSTYFPEGGKIAAELASRQAAPITFMGLGNVDPAFPQQAGLAAAQRCLFSGVPEPSQIPTAQRYVRRYTRRYDVAPGVWGTFTYDSTKLLARAIERTNSTRFKPVLRELQNTRGYKGQTGTITIDPQTGNRLKLPIYILKVNDQSTFVVAS